MKKRIKIKAVVVACPVSCCGSSSSSSVTLAQAARAWGMSERTLRRRVKSGLIRAVKAHNNASLRIEMATLHELLAARWCPKQLDEADTEVRANAEDVW